VLIGSDDQNWLTSDWIPRAMAAGLRRAALITPTFYFNRVAVESVGQRLDPQALTLQFFDSREAARAWLRAA
jgi:SpoIIAA-like